MAFEIDWSKVPPPPPIRHWPFKNWQIGQTEFFPEDGRNTTGAAQCWASRTKKKFRTKKTMENGVMGTRVWRVE